MHVTQARRGMKVKSTHPKLAGKTWLIEKANPKTARIVNVDNEYDEMSASYSLLEPVGALEGSTVEFVPSPTVLWSKGMLAKAKDGSRLAQQMPGVRVVTNVTPTKIQLYPLGGSTDGRYYTVPPALLELVTFDELMGL